MFCLLFTGLIFLIGCQNSGTQAKTENTPVTTAVSKPKEIPLLIDFNTIKGKTLAQVERKLGKAKNVEKVKGYPCENTDCKRAYFKNGDYEIIFKRNKVDRVTINHVPDLTHNDNALESLGLKPMPPTFKNPDNVIRWQPVGDINEISFFIDYILIQVTNPE